ncbi:predicted protein [Postia placenta Mad-698-R]|uniref:LYR motif-containing protein Cup1-like N-terminal domain-containing protein n=1 Tax=Postia placenta MAD-698-R-SB12 TaxID=670580 RepID=A0A1X6NF75_9APHY|nr:hypothetical protein POSPLADRAFT_1127718 [Postia placenta MAD-698-R-SB12]EED77768.1 predicted protein [Postia placenta Mad-698-R]OSX67299.1 hypothetical protein POSPLADRAFT_1127718 [Postia placenta MAD-698-R-SB12]
MTPIISLVGLDWASRQAVGPNEHERLREISPIDRRQKAAEMCLRPIGGQAKWYIYDQQCTKSFRRQIRLLPTVYLREYFKLKTSDDVRAILDTKKADLRARKIKRFEKELRKITLANQGIEKKFEHVLDLAYGRKGKLKWELINPLLTDPSIPPPERIIPAVEKSRPPVYSKELTALLTSKVSHKNKPLGHTAIRRPPTLPARADLNSEDARLLGPLSKRREVNIYWRFYTEQVKRVYPPFQMILEERDSPGETRHLTDKGALHRAGIRVGGVQGEGVYEEIETLANAPSPSQAGGTSGTDIFQASPLRPRFLRRRFASLLGRTPVLVYSDPRTQAKEHPGSSKYPFHVTPVIMIYEIPRIIFQKPMLLTLPGYKRLRRTKMRREMLRDTVEQRDWRG